MCNSAGTGRESRRGGPRLTRPTVTALITFRGSGAADCRLARAVPWVSSRTATTVAAATMTPAAPAILTAWEPRERRAPIPRWPGIPKHYR